jgi:hypothetical protein
MDMLTEELLAFSDPVLERAPEGSSFASKARDYRDLVEALGVIADRNFLLEAARFA